MASIRAFLIRKLLLPRLRDSMSFSKNSVEQLRGLSGSMQLPPGTVVEKLPIGSMNAEWIMTSSVPVGEARTILYLHGGGFVMGSCDSHRGVAAHISAASGLRVLLIEYRLAPEHPFPAANEDCLEAYRWLLAHGVDAGEIVIGGDSAGGGLVLMTLLSLRDAGEPLPAATFMLSPFAEYLRFDGKSYETMAAMDPLCGKEGSKISAGYYLGSPPSVSPTLSPLDRDLSGLPPMMIQVGQREVLQSDSTRLAEIAKIAGVEMTMEIWPGMWHVFQLFAPILPEANRAIKRIGKFIREKVD